MKPSASSLLLYSLLIQHLQCTFTRQIPFVAVTSRHSAETPSSGVNHVTNYPQDLNYHSKRNEKRESRSNRKRRNHNDAKLLESSIHVYKGNGRSPRYPTGEEYSTSSTTSRKEPLPIHIEEQYYKHSPAELARHEQSSRTLSSRNSSSNRLLRIPMSLSLQHESQTYDAVPIKTFIDTGAQTTVMTFDAAKRAGIAHLIDRRYVGHASGVAGVSCRVLGRIPANSVSFIIGEDDDIIDTSPSIAILEDRILDGEAVDMLLGLDVLEEWQAMICLRDRVLTVRNGRRKLQGKEITIPFQSSTKKSCGGLPKVNHRTKSNRALEISRESSNREGKKKQKKQIQSSNYDQAVKRKDSMYSQRSNIFARDSSLLKSELDALDERSKSRPFVNENTCHPKTNRNSQYQGLEDDFMGEDDDSDTYYSESDEDYDDCDLSGV